MNKTIFIVDDHLLIAKALKEIIDKFEGFEVLDICENGLELQQKLQNTKQVPDLVLLDISMPVMDGIETSFWLQSQYPDILVLALSMQDDEQSLLKMIQNGAKSFLLKNVHPVELEKALNTLIRNGFYYPEWVTKIIIDSIGKEKEDKKMDVKLTDREHQFLAYCSTELTYKEIADLMNCSPRTIDGYRDQLFQKLDIKSRVGLAVYALKNRIE
ncbi:MAG: DNA-binding response regulator [Flavobacteriaceae bacterium]|nr:MAG: DNA-binding response regulator [Flavobacteriaceae bacterium]